MLGAGGRATYLYQRIIRDMPEDVELVGCWSRSESSVSRLSDTLGVPGFTDMQKLKAETGAVAGICAVSYSANGAVALQAVEAGFHILTETPIAHDLAEADAVIRAAADRGLHVEVAEQFHRRPTEQIKLALIRAGVFGTIYSSFNDFVGHGYHGASVMRSYLGFDAVPVRVVGSVHEYPLTRHYAAFSGETKERSEKQEHGIVEFSDGRVGIFHWTNVGYDSALRWWRGSRFYGSHGMGSMYGPFEEPRIELSTIVAEGRTPAPIAISRVSERVDGGALTRLVATVPGGAPGAEDGAREVVWENPFAQRPGGSNPEWHDDEIGVAGCIRSLADAVRGVGDAPAGGEPTADAPCPFYGAKQARLDQEIILAIRASAEQGNAPVELPLPR
jgi:predicted dehydrogenase